MVVVGGGHAGVEAAWAAANLRARVALVTLDPTKIGVMSCNPAIGGLAKGQMVREVDALGGLMGRAADASGIMFKTLNTSKGLAVRAPRAQCDNLEYPRAVRRLVSSRAEITVIGASAERFLVERDRAAKARRVVGLVLGGPDERWSGVELRAPAVVLTTGTFMRGLMHTGERRTEGGRAGEGPAVGVSAALRELGFELGRLKTGTPPRLRRASIDWDALEPDRGDAAPAAFSDLTDGERFPAIGQTECRLTGTTAAGHDAIRANLHRAPMFSGVIESAGPRYCPSIEDKVVRFAGRERHGVFLEPESHETDLIYCNGIATSLPEDVQLAVVRAMPGCERAEVVRYGYAVEYDMVRPHQIRATCETKEIAGLFLAGQINGTSGYEEAAAQGLIAGVNAARSARGEGPVTLGREEAYAGVMMDDLVTKTPVEPYRMFTSRAEHRLLLRADNAVDRLTPVAREWGLVGEGSERWRRFGARRAAMARLDAAVDAAKAEDGSPLRDAVRRPGFTPAMLARVLGVEPGVDAPRGVVETVLAERHYAGYIKRQHAEVRRAAETGRKRIPDGFDFETVVGLRTEARQALSRFRPETLGQAGRLEGVNPADLTVLLVAITKRGGFGPVLAAAGV